MSMSLEVMRKLVRRGLGGLTTEDLPDGEVDLYLNMSLWELESKFPFKEKEARTQMETVPSQGEYSLPETLDAIISVSVHHEGAAHKLKRLSFDQHDEIFNEKRTGTPTHYKRRDRTLVLWPIPATAMPLHIVMWKSVASLLETEDEPNLPRNWHEIVVEGAVVRGHFYQEDYDEAVKAKNFQVGNIRSSVPTEAKEERDSRFAGVRVVYDYPPDAMRHADPGSHYYRKSLYGGEIP